MNNFLSLIAWCFVFVLVGGNIRLLWGVAADHAIDEILIYLVLCAFGAVFCALFATLFVKFCLLIVRISWAIYRKVTIV